VSKKPKPPAIRRTYIGVKLVEAELMDSGTFNVLTGRAPRENEDPGELGYAVFYPDGYIGWCPKATFEAANLPLADLKGDAITEQDVLGFVPINEGLKTAKLGNKTAVVQATCRTGFEITETAACVNPENYDQNTGTQIALDKIKDRLFAHLGFVLQWARSGLNHQTAKGE
jgi:hypothetical protein